MIQKQLIFVRIANIYAFLVIIGNFGSKRGKKMEFLDLIFGP